MGRRELTPRDVRKLVFESLGLIDVAQKELELPICPNIQETVERLKGGKFRVSSLPLTRSAAYQMVYGSFDPPSTITLDCDLPFCDWPLDIPDFPDTMARYAATHEVIHADDHTGGDKLFKVTMEHILDDHPDKLERGMEIIDGDGGCESIGCYRDLAGLWAMQYADMITHYRAYVTLRHYHLPRLDMIWACMQDGFFPPSLLTRLESERDTEYVFEEVIERAGEYCLIDALKEITSIGERNACSYTV